MTAVRAGAVHRAGGAVAVLIAALVVLVVLVHHETAAITSAPPRHAASSPHTGHAMPGTTSSSAALPHGSAPVHTDGLDAPAPAHGADGSACADGGMQHCASATIEVSKLPVPPPGSPPPTAHPQQVQTGRLLAGTVGRAPPDLSVLSRLRV
ncbi:hypothetical protein OG889_07420 [Streptomyces sp. NBC_00481]|uniref:hypothetical protein n=1 Tax=Streptomyces sp. NBC_00481 TaxID=2975755 RepID=UPI002DDA6E4C|nr:hypothetical protein [Streptomyces sp. NBC_00481]WRY94558.1 hypothetical protein OG889_07420 [Streptomyces sp. NBC_00481]